MNLLIQLLSTMLLRLYLHIRIPVQLQQAHVEKGVVIVLSGGT